MAGSSVELGVSTQSSSGGGVHSSSSLSLGATTTAAASQRRRAPLADLDSKFVVSKSGLCNADGSELVRGGSVRVSHPLPPSVGCSELRAPLHEGGIRFPRLDQCAHFHYEYVELPHLQVCLVSEDLKQLSSSTGGGVISSSPSRAGVTGGNGSLPRRPPSSKRHSSAHDSSGLPPLRARHSSLSSSIDSSCEPHQYIDASIEEEELPTPTPPSPPAPPALVIDGSSSAVSSSLSCKAAAGSAGTTTDAEDSENRSLLVRVTSLDKSWVVRRTYDNFRFLDRQLHKCCYDRRVSGLAELPPEENLPGEDKQAVMVELTSSYLSRLSAIAGPLITCGPVLGWLELDNRGHRLIVTDDSDINTPAVAAAYVVKRYVAQANDEIGFEVGDMISVIDMPPPEESVWWRGKRGFQVGFFPYECVQVIGDKVPQSIQPPRYSHPPGAGHHHLHPTVAPTKPVLRKHGKLIAFFRSFILSRPSRRKLKRQGILRERVFGCDLGEHLLNSGHDLPMVLKCCAEFIESHGTVDGIYRLSGITSNIQKLRNAFDEDRIPDLYGDESILQDIHCVSSVLKMYFRELPNPLLTYQLYERFVAAVTQDEEVRLLHVRDVVQQLPPPHYRTLRYLIQHLAKVACHSSETGMTPKNIAIVWAPNLLRCKELEQGGVAALQDVGTQAVVTEFLIRYVDLIFSDKLGVMSPTLLSTAEGTPKRHRPKSLAISTPTKLLTIEEARLRALTSTINPDQKYIEVGGGPQSLPKQYHTVIELPNRKGGSLKQKKSPLGWKSLFSKGRTAPKHVSQNVDNKVLAAQHHTVRLGGDTIQVTGRRLRPVKSEESLASTPASSASVGMAAVFQPKSPPIAPSVQQQHNGTLTPTALVSALSGSLQSPSEGASPIPSPRTHNRSVSHDSYFNLLEDSASDATANGGEVRYPKESAVAEERESDFETSPESSKLFLDISELNIDFNTSEAEMKIFSEDETLRSTSVEESLSKSTQDVEELSLDASSVSRSKESIGKRSLRDKLRHKFTSPALQRRHLGGSSGDHIGADARGGLVVRHATSVKDRLSNTLTPEMSRKRRKSAEDTHGTINKDPQQLRTQTSQSSATISVSEAKEGSSSPNLDDSQASEDDGRSEGSFALIDAELMAKLTKLRSSASETSSASLADATVTDNDTLASNTTSPPSTAPLQLDVSQDINDCLLHPVPHSSMTESCPALPDEKLTEQVEHQQFEQPRPRPTSLIAMTPTAPTNEGLLSVEAPSSPATPQGTDTSTFMEIQYHPLSDTTEPSTPSGNDSAATPQLFPARGARLSPELSSSGSNSPPLYENVTSDPSEDTSAVYENVTVVTNTIRRRPSLSKPAAVKIQTNGITTSNTVASSSSPSCEETMYENVDASECPEKPAGLLETALDDVTMMEHEDYEEFSFDKGNETKTKSDNVHKNIGEVQLETKQVESAITLGGTEPECYTAKMRCGVRSPRDDLQAVMVDGELVYQQVKYLRRSIQEVNELIEDTPEEVKANIEKMQVTSLQEECQDSPMTSPSVMTEVLVLPSFSSPAESTTDEVTFSEVSDLRASPSLPLPSPSCPPTGSPSSVVQSSPPTSPSSAISPVPLPRTSVPGSRRNSSKSSTHSTLSFKEDCSTPPASENLSYSTSEDDVTASLPSSPSKDESVSSEATLPKTPSSPQVKDPPPPLLRHKTSPELMRSPGDDEPIADVPTVQSREAEDIPSLLLPLEEDEATRRERIEKYKEERRMFLREKYKSESFRGEKDEMLLRLKQKATSPSRVEGEEMLPSQTLDFNDSLKDMRHDTAQSELSEPNNGTSTELDENGFRTNEPIDRTSKEVNLEKIANKSAKIIDELIDPPLVGNGISSSVRRKSPTSPLSEEDVNVKARVAVWSKGHADTTSTNPGIFYGKRSSVKGEHPSLKSPKSSDESPLQPPWRSEEKQEVASDTTNSLSTTKLKPMNSVSTVSSRKYNGRSLLSDGGQDSPTPPIPVKTRVSSRISQPTMSTSVGPVKPACPPQRSISVPYGGTAVKDAPERKNSGDDEFMAALKSKKDKARDVPISPKAKSPGSFNARENVKPVVKQKEDRLGSDKSPVSSKSPQQVHHRQTSGASSRAALPATPAKPVPALSKPSAVSQQRRIKDMAAMFEGGHN